MDLSNHERHREGPDESRPNVLKLELQKDEASVLTYVDWGFAEVDGELRLWTYHDDPDSWEFIEYTHDD